MTSPCIFNGSVVTLSGANLGPPRATAASPTPGSSNVVVDHNTVINQVSQRIGFNTSYWEDAAARRTVSNSLRNGFQRLGVTYARWPGGHEADGVTFFLNSSGTTLSTPTPRLARFGAAEWPATDATFWAPSNDYTGNFTRSLYGLQEFLDDCQATNTTPIIVVAIDTIYNAPTGTGAHNITKAQALANAAAMVQWCNVTNDYNVQYWEIGNESWSSGPAYTHGFEVGGVEHPETYGAEFADMAAAMKAVDPTIKCGLNWNDQAQFQTAIAAAGSANVDFLIAHRYPFYNMTYAQYQAVSSPNMVSEANRATNAIATLSAPDQARIFVMMTETGHISQPNDMGSAVIHAHILGAHLATANIKATLVWTSRYYPYGTSHDMFNDLNNLTPSGMGVRLAAQLGTPTAKVVTATSGVTNVYAYATYDHIQRRIAVLLINRSNSTQVVTVATAGMTTARLALLSGSGPTDVSPTIVNSTPTITAGVSSVSLPAASVGMLITTS